MSDRAKKLIREVRGRIPQDLKIAFEIACANMEVSQAGALEEAIAEWLTKREQPTSVEPLEFKPQRPPADDLP